MKPEPLTAAQLIERLRQMGDPANVAGMARFGINAANTLGVSMPRLRELAKGWRDQQLSLELWASGIHEARILAALVGEPARVTQQQMDAWVLDFDSWDVCDQVCMNLFDRTPWAFEKAVEYAGREEEFVKRAGFALMASLAWHDKSAPDQKFLDLLPVIQLEAADQRNFVKKAVNWALRQIGKRNPALSQAAVATAREILLIDSKAARWVANDALRELENLPENRYKK
ncbi:MAG TPA: DNA alkylation repair protein [Bellilinea sp.]|nr:DNA alkylation repair protein [Bellilinea sp.]